MNLRTSGDLPNSPGRQHRRFRLPVALGAAAVVLLTLFAAGSGAGVSSYQGTLYFAGPASSRSSSSWQITTTAGPAAPTAPTLLAGAAGSGSLTAATYQYIYVRSSGGAYTASAVSATATVPANGSVSVSVSALELGGDLYRARATGGVVLGNYVLASPPGGVTTVPYVDTGAVSGVALPQADTRHATGAGGVGWSEFAPGTGVASTLVNSAVSGSTPALPATCKGWIVDASGGMSFPPQNWTFQVRIKPGGNPNGTAVLSAAMWKVDDSGNTTGGYLIAPTDGDTITSSTGMALNATVTANPGVFTLGAGEHLCVQFWRHQTGAYTSGGASNRSISLLPYDAANSVAAHPDPDTAPPVTTIDTPPPVQSNLASGTIAFSANESVTGFQCRIDVAAYAACTSPYGYGPLLDGLHTFDVKAVADLVGNPGAPASYGWTIDTAPPDTSIVSAPSVLSTSANPSFDLSSTENGSFECSLDGAPFTACSDPKTYSALADGAHTFQVRALDGAGNVDPTPTSHSWTIDATPPDTTIGPTQPSALTTATSATFDFSSNEPGSFACQLDSGSLVACSTPKTYSGLADGTHTFSVRAIDTASNTDATPASYTWTIDTTAPDTTIGPTTPPANTPSSNASFDFSANEPGATFTCRLDGGAYGPCTSPAAYSGLGNGPHTFDVRATDPAGNLDASAASYTWAIDNVGPATPTLVAPADGLMTNGAPQLQATFDDTTPGDTGSVDFQICSSAAPAGSACVPVVQAATSAGHANGDTASITTTALPDGTYHWQARAQDAAGNQSGWSATRSFQLDTAAPAVTLGEPADGAWVKSIHLTATFSKQSFAGTGSVEFRVCSDALCLGVLKTAQTGAVLNGGLADWTPTGLGDGLYYWQARAHDSAGNVSAWSGTRTFTRDTIPPGKPVHFNGQVGPDGLTLRWESPGGTIANYVVFVDGKPWKNLGPSEFEVKLGPFDESDGRTFSIVATDPAGNVGAMSPVLVGVPKLVGLTLAEATRAASARGFELHHPALLLKAEQLVISSQDPQPSTLAEQGSAVNVTVAAAQGVPLVVRVNPGRVRSRSGSFLRLRIQLSAPAVVTNQLLNAKGRLVKSGRFGHLRAGTTTVRLKLPASLRRGAYRLVLEATDGGDTARAFVRVNVTPRKPA